MFDFKGKSVLITGASYGLGEQFAYAFADAGADLVLTARSEELLEGVGEACREKGSKVTVATGDVSVEDDVLRVVEQGIADHGKIDVLINNAGITKDNLSLRMKNEEWQKVIDINLSSTFYLCKSAIKKMIKNKFYDENFYKNLDAQSLNW